LLDSLADSGIDPRKVSSAGNDLFKNAFVNNVQISGLPDLPTLVHIRLVNWSQITLSSISMGVAPYHPSTGVGCFVSSGKFEG